MRSPPQMLEDFEARHGTFDDMLDRSINLMLKEDEFSRRERSKVESLIRQHDRLIWMNMGWQMAGGSK